jgi:hypothetical protein
LRHIAHVILYSVRGMDEEGIRSTVATSILLDPFLCARERYIAYKHDKHTYIQFDHQIIGFLWH